MDGDDAICIVPGWIRSAAKEEKGSRSSSPVRIPNPGRACSDFRTEQLFSASAYFLVDSIAHSAYYEYVADSKRKNEADQTQARILRADLSVLNDIRIRVKDPQRPTATIIHDALKVYRDSLVGRRAGREATRA